MTATFNALEAQQQLARITLAIVTMRANTPDGDHFADHFGDTFAELAGEAVGIAGDDVAEHLFLNMLDMAHHLLDQLIRTTGLDASHWLRERSLDIENWHYEDSD
ncbi:MAG TPA: hypothetical protein VGN18_07830 [Jatrophihabitans sp.]|jgi:hypothetical protein|uniref:hypothetical protein n=1 Tax=Jatrophihabitans sp. TaxID=1932789 RepID=UPI002E05B906|nr:hypothetical protein [Jatrophihabitans sp.]